MATALAPFGRGCDATQTAMRMIGDFEPRLLVRAPRAWHAERHENMDPAKLSASIAKMHFSPVCVSCGKHAASAAATSASAAATRVRVICAQNPALVTGANGVRARSDSV